MQNMTLGEIVDVLKRKDPTWHVYYDFVQFAPEGIHSYRGYYDQIALGYGHKPITVAELLGLCQGAIGKDFEGYKGGTYTMHATTPVWVANYDESGSTAIVDIVERGYGLCLVTANMD